MQKILTKASESLFWYWITERHAIFLKRQAGRPKPWTVDPILQQYKFTNPFRENDRGTIWLRENFLEPHRNDDLGLLAFNICWFRMFNWFGTGYFLGWQTDWEPDIVKYDLNNRAQEGHKIFTSAHIVRSAFGKSKIDATVDVCTDLWKLCQEGLVEIARDTRSLELVFNRLCTVDYVGPFMAYEMVTDMRHTRLLEDATDIMTWANPGPGAKRGLQRLGLPSKPDGAAIEAMRGLLERSRVNLPEWVPDLEMRDIEHSLCEFDKYCRVEFGEGEPKSRYPGVA